MPRSLLFTVALLLAALSMAACTLHREGQLTPMEAEIHGI